MFEEDSIEMTQRLNPGDVQKSSGNFSRFDWFDHYQLFETLQTDQFQKLIFMAEFYFDIDGAAITLLDDSKQYELGSSTEELKVIDVGESICQYTVGREDVVVIPDVSKKPEIEALESVDTSKLRSYAGVPLQMSDGMVLGSFCLLHSSPRNYSPNELDHLRLFRDQAINLIEQHVQSQELSEAISLLDSTLGATVDGILVVQNRKHLIYNDRFLEIWNVGEKQMEALEPEAKFDFLEDRIVAPDGLCENFF